MTSECDSQKHILIGNLKSTLNQMLKLNDDGEELQNNQIKLILTPQEYSKQSSLLPFHLHRVVSLRILRNLKKKVPASSYLTLSQGFPDGSVVKNPPTTQELCVQSLCQENPLEMETQPTPVFLHGESPGQRRLAGYSLWGSKRVRHVLATRQQQLTLSH